jgi:hypothetical protein
VAATNLVVPQWIAIAQSIASNGGNARINDFVSEMNADSKLLAELDRISFSGQTAGLAASFETYLREYVAEVRLIVRQGATAAEMAELDHIDQERSDASGLFRAALGLSANYGCQWVHPDSVQSPGVALYGTSDHAGGRSA